MKADLPLLNSPTTTCTRIRNKDFALHARARVPEGGEAFVGAAFFLYIYHEELVPQLLDCCAEHVVVVRRPPHTQPPCSKDARAHTRERMCFWQR